ncbi:dTDP-4-dehydrorhamnose reductase [Gammaproteobacteria bacterium 45_16_T64]|nr:dTDP-4-dehydrorhamnose reductase [Gammaproteobacteria bacterium 45_16_T64]
MKVLLTGGPNGQLGAEIIQAFKTEPFELTPLARSQLDITQAQDCIDIIRNLQPDIVVNVAAYTAVDKAEDEQEAAYSTNRNGTHNLAIACANEHSPLIHISTDYVFDGLQVTPYKESATANPSTIYGKSKWEGEEKLRNTLREHIIIRTSWIFSQYGSNFVKTILSLCERDNINIVHDQTGAPTSAQSITQAIISLCHRYNNNKTLPWGTYHFTGTPQTTWYDFAANIVDIAYKTELVSTEIKITPITTKQFPTKTNRPTNSTLNCDRILSALGISQSNWKDDLQLVLEQLKTNRRNH